MKNKLPSALTVISLIISLTGGVILTFIGAHLYLSPSLPSVETLKDIKLQTPLRIYSEDDKLIGEIGEKRRTPIKYQDIPQAYIDALLSAEDAQFYSHNGVSIKGLMRALSQLLMSGDIQGGGSTITMQVARNYFLSKKQEFKRKFNEILLALKIERELSKEEILELYVNVIFLGNRAYGIEAAAQVYYGKSLPELNTAQLAMIAGLPKAPSTMNPLANPQRALERRNWILGRMLELEKIDQGTFTTAVHEPVTAKYHGNSVELNASYIAEMARQKALEQFGNSAYTDGYKIYTTVNSQFQKVAQKAVIGGLFDYDRRHGYRGPEQQIPPPDSLEAQLTATDSNDNGDSAEVTKNDDQPKITEYSEEYNQWIETLSETLKQIPQYADLVPAAVISIDETGAQCLTKDGTQHRLTWENNLSEIPGYISVYRTSSPKNSIFDLLSLGDIVRIKKLEEDSWTLAQLPEAQAALVSIKPSNGAVLALVGGLDFSQSNFNRAIQAERQPGSNFKPFLYTAALENGFTAASIINDAPIVFEDDQLESTWRPENSSGKFYGPTRLRKALYLSRNLVSIRVLQSVGIANALKNIDRFGLDPDKMPHDLSLALGSHAVTPMEVATGYAVFANGGYKVEPYFIERIEDIDGNIVFQALPKTVCENCEPPSEEEIAQALKLATQSNDPFLFIGDPFSPKLLGGGIHSQLGVISTHQLPLAPKVIDDQVAFIMDSMLRDVVRRGTATKARKAIDRNDLAGKTGTTNNSTDTWFSGYAGNIVTTTWLGFDQVSSLGREYGSTGALPIWIDYMKEVLKGRPEYHPPQPPNLVTVRIDPETGKRARVDNPNAIFEVFRTGNVPELEDGDRNNLSPWQEESPDISTESIF